MKGWGVLVLTAALATACGRSPAPPASPPEPPPPTHVAPGPSPAEPTPPPLPANFFPVFPVPHTPAPPPEEVRRRRAEADATPTLDVPREAPPAPGEQWAPGAPGTMVSPPSNSKPPRQQMAPPITRVRRPQ